MIGLSNRSPSRDRRATSHDLRGFLWTLVIGIVVVIVNVDAILVVALQTKSIPATRQLRPGHRHPTSFLWASSNPAEDVSHPSATTTTTKTTTTSLGAPICLYHQVDVPSSEPNPVPRQAISVEDLTPTLQSLLEESGMANGLITVISRHTTTSLTINEWESRLAEDIAESLLALMPPDERSSSPASQEGVTYQHNDIDLRPFGDAQNYNPDSEEAQRCRENGWEVDDPEQLQAWRDQEPINAHSHLLSILAGSSSESIPVVEGRMVLGQWQSVLLLDLDGPRDRTVGVQLMGYS